MIIFVRRLIFALLLTSVCGTAYAVGLETLLMPGRVIEGHADTEDDCGACHDNSSDQATAALCTSCHEDVGSDRAALSGFHGRFDPARKQECVACHTDHEGRDADIVAINAGMFDHRFTDFALSGAHLNVTCDTCHTPGEKYGEAATSCNACHVEDDVHRGGLGEDCRSCHSSADWKTTRFDHSQTSYPLSGRHADVACTDCHRDNKFSNTPQRCASCHAIDDVHAGNNGDVCSDCHSTSSWGGIRFDHNTTDFPLIGEHDRLQCTDCHERQDFKDHDNHACVNCHITDDDHQGRNGRECDTCHQPTLWPDTTFLHIDTGFTIIGAHTDLNCSSCHKDATMSLVANSCGSCHTADDSHGGQLDDNCSQCHTQTSWHNVAGFDHDLGSFPLTGMHATVACGECHTSNRFHDATSSCVSCHADDDPHEDSLGGDCASCHNSNDWGITDFDHDLHTAFALDGAHQDLVCNACHSDDSSSAADVPSTCGGCHISDDVHAGQFGSKCGDCHATSSFRDVESLSGRRK
jgi:hypothetical protein